MQQLLDDYSRKMKGLIFFRALFALLLLGSSVIYGFQHFKSTPVPSFLIILGLCVMMLVESAIYFLIYRKVPQAAWFAYLQLIVDSFMITMIVFITGSFISFFAFLYLIVIICSSMFLFKTGSLIIAVVCSIQYTFLILFEFWGILPPINIDIGVTAADFGIHQILFKIVATIIACFAVAFLSSVLAEQEKRTKKELQDLEEHVKRVEKSAAIGEMAAGLAHEIKNPLASLSGSIQLLKEEIRYDPQHDKLMRIVLREADRLSRLVSDFLLFARPAIGKPVRFNLHKFLSETIELFKKDRTCLGVIEFVEPLDGNLFVEMDPGHLQQVLWNLFLNAAYSVDENGKVSISLYPVKKTHVCIEVRDNGCGMSEETLKSIFDPFFTTRPEGTGLGLSIVQRILSTYDCQLDVESRIHHGTAFTLKLKQVAPAGSEPS
ncbi:MAG: ATP-binding protein [Pseudomonadota bacterium]